MWLSRTPEIQKGQCAYVYVCLTNTINKILFIVPILNLCIPCNKQIKTYFANKYDKSFFGRFSHYSVRLQRLNMQLKEVDLFILFEKAEHQSPEAFKQVLV